MGSAWRVCPAVHAATGLNAFSGIGSRLYGGRWNSKGVTVAYGSATLSLAALEFLVHADARLLRTVDLVSCDASWPESLDVEVLAASSLPSRWRNTPPPLALATLGDRWVRERRSAILLVPSALVPSEKNVLINPAHPEARRITYGGPARFSYDPRLL
jgi:RES domain-containing protein